MVALAGPCHTDSTDITDFFCTATLAEGLTRTYSPCPAGREQQKSRAKSPCRKSRVGPNLLELCRDEDTSAKLNLFELGRDAAA